MTSEDLVLRDRAAILHDLGSPDEEVRRLAVERLLELPSRDAVPHLLALLGDESWRVRKAVVGRVIACPESAEMDSALIGALADGENPGRRNSAFEAIVGMGKRMTSLLVDILSSEDADVRKLAVDALAGLGDPAACGPVIAALRDPDPNIRGAAADALGVIGDQAAGAAMHRVVMDENEDSLVRLSSLRSLARIEHALSVQELGPVLDDAVLRPAAYTLLGFAGDTAAVDCLLKGLTLESTASREAAIGALLTVLSQADGGASEALARRIQEASLATPSIVDWTVERLPEADLATRMALIQFLGLTRDARCVVPLLEAGRDEAMAEISHATLEELDDVTAGALEEAWEGLDTELRSDACRLLGCCHSSEAADALLLQSLDDADGLLRAAAAAALGRRGRVSALPSLIRHLESAAVDDDPDAGDEVESLIDALVAMASPERSDADAIAGEVIDLLSLRLDGASEEVRLAIASVLGRIGRGEDEALVADLMRDPSARVRRAAVEAVARLEPGAASESLRLALADESPLVRIASAAALGQSMDPEVVADLQRLLHDEDARVSAAAVRSIGTHCQRETVSAELGIGLVSRALEGDGMVALAAIEALCLIGGEGAATAVLPALERSEPELVQAAVACVGAHGDEEAVTALLVLVSHPAWSVRAEAIQILAERRVFRARPAILRRLETEQDSFVRDAILRALRQLED